MKIKADLHNHPSGNFNQIVSKISKNLGPGGVLGYINYANTNPYTSFIKTKDRDTQDLGNAIYIPQQGILIIRGQEIPTILKNGKIGEVVVLGLKQNLPTNLKLEELLNQAESESGIIYCPHPFLPDSIGNELQTNLELLEYFHALEVYNSQAGLFDHLGPLDANKEAQEFYNQEIRLQYLIGAISSTDRFAIGRSYSLLEQPDIKDSDSLKESLKQSITQHQNYSQDKQSPSRISTLVHIAKVLTFDKTLANIPGLNTWLKEHELIH